MLRLEERTSQLKTELCAQNERFADLLRTHVDYVAAHPNSICKEISASNHRSQHQFEECKNFFPVSIECVSFDKMKFYYLNIFDFKRVI